MNGVTAAIDGTGTVTVSVPYEIDEDGEVTFTLPFELKPEMKITLTIGNQTPVIIGVGDYYTPGGGKFELKAKIDPRGLTGVSRPATLRMNVALGREAFARSAGVSEGEWNKLSTKEWVNNFPSCCFNLRKANSLEFCVCLDYVYIIL